MTDGLGVAGVVRPLVVFDLDGTLFDPAPLTVRALHSALARYGLRPLEEAEIVAGIGEPGSTWYRELVAAMAEPAVVDAVMAAFHDRERALVSSEGRLFDGVEDMLAEVRAGAGAMVLCTNGFPEYVDRVLARTGIQRFFDEVCAGGGGRLDKPALVARIVARRGRPGVVVGDRFHDVEAARRNGLASIGAAYGYGTERDFEGCHAVALAPSDVPELVRRLSGPAGGVG